MKTKEEKYAKILYRKQYITPEELLNGYPSEFATYIKYCKGLDYNEEPDYNYLTGLFSNVIKNYLKEEIDFKYDWIKNDIEEIDFKYDWIKNDIDLNKSIRENYITDEGINNSYLNNTSMVNNMNNSTSILNNNSNIIYENEHKNNKINNINNINNKETNYYDKVMEETNLKKNDNFDNEKDNDENSPKNGKRKHAPCCILY